MIPVHQKSERLVARPGGEPQPPGTQASGRAGNDWSAIASAVLVVGVNVLVITDFQVPFLRPAIGFWFLVVAPVYLLCTTSLWGASSVAERVGYSTAAVLLLLMIGGLALNTFLPLLDYRRPLDPVPVLLLGDTLLVALYLFRRRRPAKVVWRRQMQTLGRKEGRVLAGSGLCAAVAVLGANRINNGAGSQLSLAALSAVVVTLFLLLLWRQHIRDGMISATLYLVSLALLLMTSLRGWYVTGHDIQFEYRVFQLTQAHGHWSMEYFHNAYNACLSITILPTEISRIVQVDNPYVFKVFVQLIFALCPVLVYTIARRYWSKSISILAVIFFVGFPTFLTDMPFLNRQEVAYIFVCVAILSITNNAWSRRQRQLGLVVASVGIELSHYSTMYVFLDALIIALVVKFLSVLNPRRLHSLRGKDRVGGAPWAVTAQTAGLGCIALMVGVTYLWGQLATQTADNVVTESDSAISGLIQSSGMRSNDVLYGLLPAKTASPQVLLNNYREQVLKERAISPDKYIPAAVVARYPTLAVNQPVLPLTEAGRLLSDSGISPAGLNSAVREFAAKGEQVFIIIGLLTLLLVRSRRAQVSREIWFLCVGSLGALIFITVLPNLSVGYGILRTFQQALILVAPVLVVGSLAIFSPLGRTWAARAAAAFCICIFISTTGLLPQILGGYPAQLSLNNSGLYYNIYYVHPQEEAAVNWLSDKPAVLPDGLQASFSGDRFIFNSPSDVTGSQVTTDIYPWQIQKSSWVFLSYATTHMGVATIYPSTGGDLITYMYPKDLLWNTKNLVYNNGSAEIYR